MSLTVVTASGHAHFRRGEGGGGSEEGGLRLLFTQNYFFCAALTFIIINIPSVRVCECVCVCVRVFVALGCRVNGMKYAI